jgi:hypothetical protein
MNNTKTIQAEQIVHGFISLVPLTLNLNLLRQGTSWKVF